MMRTCVTLEFAVLVLAAVPVVATAEPPLAYRLQQIPPGTVAVDSDADRFNRLILLARPALSSGEIDRLPEGFEQSVTRYSYTIMATVSRSVAEDAYRLAEVGLGYSEPDDGRQVVVTASGENAELGMMERRVLSQSEDNLKKSRVVVRSSTVMMFDLVVLMSRAGGHRHEFIRNLLWVNPKSGEAALAIWSLGPGRDVSQSGASLTVSDDPLQIHPIGARVENRLHVDGNSILLGIPTSKTFGSERLLPGMSVAWTDALGEVAGRRTYSAESFATLTTALNEAVRSVLGETTASQ